VLKSPLLLTTGKFIHYDSDAIRTVVDPRDPLDIYTQREKYYCLRESVVGVDTVAP
jgi:hypothetical protein